ncbi:MAG TPA: serine/threonine-protein kinase, partial [Planctomycetota bacterium]
MLNLSDDELDSFLERFEEVSAAELTAARERRESELRSGARPRSLITILRDEGVLTADKERRLREAASAPTRVLPGRRDKIPPEVGPASEDPSRRLGPYILLKEVGRGGMGRVWRAWDPQVGRIVALKVLEGGDPDARERFVREAQIAGRLNHPNIAHVFHAGETSGRGWIAMQFIEGAAVDALPVAVPDAVARVRDAARALAYAHEQGVVHRDVKPGNILVEDGGRVFITDFGLAKDHASERSAPMSITGAVLGTPQYMAPEQARGDRRVVGPRSDVYSLGATLYALLAGHPPFQGRDVAALIVAVASKHPPAVRKFNPRVSPELEMLLERAMAKRPDDRFPSAAAFADALDRLLREKRYEGRYGLAKLLARRWWPALVAGVLLGVTLRLAIPFVFAPSTPKAAAQDEAAGLVSAAAIALGVLETLPPEERPARAETEVLRRLDRALALRPGEARPRILRARTLAVTGRTADAEKALRDVEGLADWRVPFLRGLLRLQAAAWPEAPLPDLEGPSFGWTGPAQAPGGEWLDDLRRVERGAVPSEDAGAFDKDQAAMLGLIAFGEGAWEKAAKLLEKPKDRPAAPCVRRAWLRAAYLARRFDDVLGVDDAGRERLGAGMAKAATIEELEGLRAVAQGDARAEAALGAALASKALDAGMDPTPYVEAAEKRAKGETLAVLDVCRLRRRALAGHDEAAKWKAAIEALKAPVTWAGKVAAAEARLGLGARLKDKALLEEAVARADALGTSDDRWAAPKTIRAAARARLGRPTDALGEIERMSGSPRALILEAWISLEIADAERRAGRAWDFWADRARRRS